VLGVFVPGHPHGIEVHVGRTARYRAPGQEWPVPRVADIAGVHIPPTVPDWAANELQYH
jgi:hypothetical protein